MQAATESDIEVALLTGGGDRPYAFGLARALAAAGIRLDVIGGDNLTPEDFLDVQGVRLLHLRREPSPTAGLFRKAAGILLYYARLIRYAATAKPSVFHLLWNNKFETIDRVWLMLYYRALGKRVVLTLHNVNTGARDATDTRYNRATLRFQYRLSDHIFVHTEKMKSEVVERFDVSAEVVTVIPFGINNAAPQTPATPAEARSRLGIGPGEKVILFFGNIAPYKGLEYLLDAFRRAAQTDTALRLIVAGRPKKGFEDYWQTIRESGLSGEAGGRITVRSEYIPESETELYFKAADALALPYTSIFQSGVLFLAYSFGLPVLAADVGSLKEDIIEGRTGFVFAPRDPADLARAIHAYFGSELFRDLEGRRHDIAAYARSRYSWEPVADATGRVYAGLLNPSGAAGGHLLSPR